MDSNNWLFGFSQNFLSDLLILIIAAAGGAVMIWAKEKGWRWTAPILYGVLTSASLYFLLSGFLRQREASVSWWVLGAVLFISLCGMWGGPRVLRRMKGQGPLPLSVVMTSEIRPLKDAPYLSIAGKGGAYTSALYDEKGLLAKSPELWLLPVTNGIFPGDVGATEATGIRVEITYYDAKWQRVCGPIQGCWMDEKKRRGDAEIYLSPNSITLEPQNTYSLVIAIKLSKGTPFFALGSESLSFLFWRNPAFKLNNHFLLRILVKGEVIQRTFYYQIDYSGEDKVNMGLVQPPDYP